MNNKIITGFDSPRYLESLFIDVKALGTQIREFGNKRLPRHLKGLLITARSLKFGFCVRELFLITNLPSEEGLTSSARGKLLFISQDTLAKIFSQFID